MRIKTKFVEKASKLLEAIALYNEVKKLQEIFENALNLEISSERLKFF